PPPPPPPSTPRFRSPGHGRAGRTRWGEPHPLPQAAARPYPASRPPPPGGWSPGQKDSTPYHGGRSWTPPAGKMSAPYVPAGGVQDRKSTRLNSSHVS